MTEGSIQKKRKRRRLKLLLGVPTLLFILSVIGALCMDAIGRKRLNQAIAEARALGQPVTFDEILAQRKVWPADQDAGRYFGSIRAHLLEVSKRENLKQLPLIGEADLPPLGQLWSSELDQAISAQLDLLSEEISQINRLNEFPGGSLPLTVAPNMLAAMFPAFSELRFSAKLKYLDIINKVSNEETASLVDDINLLIRHGQLVSDHPTLISFLVKIAIYELTVQAIEHVTALGTLPSDQLVAIGDLLTLVESDDSINWALLGERAFHLNVCQFALKNGQSLTPQMPAMSNVFGVRGWLMHDIAFTVRKGSELIQISDKPRQLLQKATQLDSEIASLSNIYVLTKLLCSSPVRAIELGMVTTARIRAARLGLAVERYRIDRGSFPDRIELLAPEYIKELPRDPFDDQALRYKVTSDAAIVYSIGDDGVDNGGDVQDVTRKKRSTDAGFTVLRPERRRLPAEVFDTATQTSPATN